MISIFGELFFGPIHFFISFVAHHLTVSLRGPVPKPYGEGCARVHGWDGLDGVYVRKTKGVF